MHRSFRWLFVLLWLLPSADLAAQTSSIDAFVGQWQGSGISKTSESLYFGETVRDFDVEIRRQGAGFNVKWTTVLRQGGDPNNPDVRRNSAEKTFQPSSNGRYYVASSLPDPLSGQDFAWARIEGSTLSVYIMTIDEEGLFNMQIYERTLTAPGMVLRFTRVRGSEPTRTVEGRLVKVAN